MNLALLARTRRTPRLCLSSPHAALTNSRGLCAAAAERLTQRKNALLLLGLEPGATQKQIKLRYYDLAKRTHPDVLAQQAKEAAAQQAKDNVHAKVRSYNVGVIEEDYSKDADHRTTTVVPFLEVQAAYDTLMNDDASADTRPVARPGAAGRANSARQRSLGEVLCDRLKEEPEAHEELWEEILREKMRVTEPMLDALFKAARRTAKKGDAVAKVEAARCAQRIIIDGTYGGVLGLDARCSAFVSLLSWCQAEEEALGDLALEVVEQINDEERAHSPAVMAAIGAVFCSGTRSPY